MSVDEIKRVYEETLNLISLYSSFGLTIPFALKGNLGELLVQIELLQRFPDKLIDFIGGARPGIDIVIENQVKIQVKTHIKLPPALFRGGHYDFEGCPTIKKAILDDKKCDYLVLVVLYPSAQFDRIEKQNIYVFQKDDFRFFSTNLCWSGNSKGDYTIVNILGVEGIPPNKLKTKIDFYHTPEYSSLFEDAKDNWGKISRSLSRNNGDLS